MDFGGKSLGALTQATYVCTERGLDSFSGSADPNPRRIGPTPNANMNFKAFWVLWSTVDTEYASFAFRRDLGVSHSSLCTLRTLWGGAGSIYVDLSTRLVHMLRNDWIYQELEIAQHERKEGRKEGGIGGVSRRVPAPDMCCIGSRSRTRPAAPCVCWPFPSSSRGGSSASIPRRPAFVG